MMSSNRLNNNEPLKKSATDQRMARPTEEQRLQRARTVGRFFASVKQSQEEKLYEELVHDKTQPAQIRKEIQDVQQDVPPKEMQVRITRLGDLLSGRRPRSLLDDAGKHDITDDEQPQQRKQP